MPTFNSTHILTLAGGLLAGGFLSFFFLRLRRLQLRQALEAQIGAELAVLKERLDNRGREIATLQQERARDGQQIAALQQENTQLQKGVSQLSTQLAAEKKNAVEKLQLLEEARLNLADAFKALSAEALKSNNQSFLQLARATLERFHDGAKGDLQMRQKAIDQLVAPLKDSLEKVDHKLHSLEQARTHAYASLTEQLKQMATTQNKLHQETNNLVKALRAPTVRGRWGEIQLRRVVEIAGMVPYCDFVEQESVATGEGRLRPDMVIKLPNSKNIVVDAKAPLQAYLNALETENEQEKSHNLQEHARHIRTHLGKLSTKAYWSQFQPSPEFVVLFLPGETFFGAALEQDPSLIEFGVGNRVLLATPTTLIALLKAVAYGWGQEQVAKNAQEISELGKALYERIATLSGHFDLLGKNLEKAVDSYNRTVGSMESRVLVSARKLKELGAVAEKELHDPTHVEKAPRPMDFLAEPD